MAGAANIIAGLTGSTQAIEAAEILSDVTNPGGLLALILGSSQSQAGTASSVYDLATFPFSLKDILKINKLGIGAASGIVADVLDYYDNIDTLMPVVDTPPIDVNGEVEQVPYYIAPMADTLATTDGWFDDM